MAIKYAAPAKPLRYLTFLLAIFLPVAWIWGETTHNWLLEIIAFLTYLGLFITTAKIGKSRIIDFQFVVGNEDKAVVRVNYDPSIGAGFIYVNQQYLLVDGQIAQWMPGKKDPFSFEVGDLQKHTVALAAHGFRIASWARELRISVVIDGKSLDLSEVSLQQ